MGRYSLRPLPIGPAADKAVNAGIKNQQESPDLC